MALTQTSELKAEPTIQPTFEPKPSSWFGELALTFSLVGRRTEMRRRHHGPLLVQRPFYPESDGTCHVYLLHQPGGIAGGDRLDFSHTLGAGARALMTTPGATKFYRSAQAQSVQRTRIEIGSGAVCEHLPNETIVFDGANGVSEIDVLLDDGATYIGWDVVCFGRPAAGEKFLNGSFRQRTRIFRAGRPIWYEQLKLAGGSDAMTDRYALDGHPVVGTLTAAGAMAEGTADKLRAAIGSTPESWVSISQIDDVLICRFLGAKTSVARRAFVAAWSILRQQLQGKSVVEPRIWAT